MTTSRILLAIALLTAVAACDIGGGETRTGANAACFPVAAACSRSSDCCSYGCLSGVCVANPVEGGACRTTNDCVAGRLCKSGACTTATAGMCRDNADVCTSYTQCCSGNCESASCTQNRAPIANAGPADVPDAPYTQPYVLQNASTDPDGDPLSYGWTVTGPDGSAVALTPSASAATPTFVPMLTGAYSVHLVVTDGPTGAPNRLTSQAQVTIHAVNRAPQPTATAAGATCLSSGGGLSCSRNNPVRISATASDPDGDTLECGWTVAIPAGAPDSIPATVFTACNNPSSTFLDFTPAGEGTYTVSYVVRDHDRTTNAIVHTVSAPATFVSRNDPPVPAVSRTPYYANMGETAGTTPAVTLDASSSTDPNGDQLVPPGPLSFFWEMISWPGAPAAPAPAIAAFDTATPSFVPAAEGDHVLRVRVSDPPLFGRASASASLDVTVRVGHYVQPLGHTVADAARAAAASPNKIVLAGTDPADATKGMIWVYDMATGTEAAGIRLVDSTGASGLPALVDVTPDGTKVVVVDQGVSIWIVSFGATTTMSRIVRPFAIGDLVVSGNRYAFLFKSGGDDYLRQLDLTTGAITQPAGSGYSAFGAAGQSGTTPLLYRVDSFFGDWYRYTVTNNGNNNVLTQTAYVWGGAPSCGSYPAQPATAIWGTLTGSYVVSSCGQVYNGTTLADLASPLGVSPSYVDSTAAGAILACAGTSLTRYDAALGSPATDVLPAWSQDGFGRTAFATKAFFNADGSKRFAVVHDTATPVRYGIVTFP
ncbi:MAG TPA: hypothetical protein VF841_10375 [Anaeromyxobacter sp.]